MVLLCPLLSRRKKIFVRQFGQRSAPIVANRRGFRRVSHHQRQQVRPKIVTAAALEFVEQGGRPVGGVILQAVAEHRVGRLIAEGREQTIAHGAQMLLNRSVIVVVEHKAISAG